MVDELSRSLAAEGCEVLIISPFYNYNKKGEVDYLKREGVVWKMNFTTYIGHQRAEVGCHSGVESGINMPYSLYTSLFF